MATLSEDDKSSSVAVTEESKSCSGDGEPAILALGGSFNPVHKSHVELLAHIKEHIDKKGRFRVVAAYLVLTTDGYVAGKLKHWAMKFEHRAALCKLAIADAGHSHWMRPSHVAQVSAARYARLALFDFHSDKTKKSLYATHILNCLGADKVLLGNGHGIWRYIGQSADSSFVAMGRKGYTKKVRKLYRKDVSAGIIDSDAFVFIDSELQSTSSTQIRKHMRDLMEEDESGDGSDEMKKSDTLKATVFREKTDEMLPLSCIEYVIQNAGAELFIRSAVPKSAKVTSASARPKKKKKKRFWPFR